MGRRGVVLLMILAGLSAVLAVSAAAAPRAPSRAQARALRRAEARRHHPRGTRIPPKSCDAVGCGQPPDCTVTSGASGPSSTCQSTYTWSGRLEAFPSAF